VISGQNPSILPACPMPHHQSATLSRPALTSLLTRKLLKGRNEYDLRGGACEGALGGIQEDCDNRALKVVWLVELHPTACTSTGGPSGAFLPVSEGLWQSERKAGAAVPNGLQLVCILNIE
jgi:hypothetical protein